MQNDDFGIDDPSSPWKIDIVVETMTDDSTEAYKFAVKHWEDIIVGNLDSYSTEGLEEVGCAMPYPGAIDDLYICARDEMIDGVGGEMLLCYILLFQKSSFSHTHSLPHLINILLPLS